MDLIWKICLLQMEYTSPLNYKLLVTSLFAIIDASYRDVLHN